MPSRLLVFAVLVFAVLVSSIATAHADELSNEKMAALMHTYVGGEQLASIPFALSGVATVTAGGLLLKGGTLEHGAAWPLLSVGAIEVIAGAILAIRTGAHEDRLDLMLKEHPLDYARLERAHIARIQNRFQPILLGFEAAVLVTGGVLAGVGASGLHRDLEGVGIGLAVQGLVLFLLDWAVLDRARAYSTALDELLPPTGRTPGQ